MKKIICWLLGHSPYFVYKDKKIDCNVYRCCRCGGYFENGPHNVLYKR